MTSNDHQNVWMPLEVAAAKVRRQPRLLRKWIDRGMPHLMHKHRLYVKLRDAVQWTAAHPRRNTPRSGDGDT